jgi:hypothetical protein
LALEDATDAVNDAPFAFTASASGAPSLAAISDGVNSPCFRLVVPFVVRAHRLRSYASAPGTLVAALRVVVTFTFFTMLDDGDWLARFG